MSVYRGRLALRRAGGRSHPCIGRVVTWLDADGVPTWDAIVRPVTDVIIDLVDGDEVEVILVDRGCEARGHVDDQRRNADWLHVVGDSLAPI